jgi:glycosyltransferase involved in cell wall biosynthesis
VPTLHNTLSLEMTHARSLKGRFLHWLVKRLYPTAPTVVSVSEEAADDLARVTGMARDAIVTIHNPVITPEVFVRAQQPNPHPWLSGDHESVVLAIGRLVAHKDFSTLIRAFAHVSTETKARLIILGEGEQRVELERLVRQLDVVDRVDLPGFVDNPYSYLSRASAFVLSSQREGLPTVLIEALALEVPIVSTDCKSGPKEILEGGRYGRIVPVGDVSSMSRAISDVLREPLEPNGAAAWSRYTLEAATDRYLEVVAGLQRE